jgi:divalent metal cation (Fe/Co/Zn/Cd) transporter
MEKQLAQRAKALQFFTIAWNVVEGAVSLAAGVYSGRAALVGFGVDSFIEVASATTALWRVSDGSAHDREHRELRSLRIIGVLFLALAVYLIADSAHALWTRERPTQTTLGIAITALSLLVMPILAHLKRNVAHTLKSHALAADSRQTDFCAYLSAIVLGGLLLDRMLGWWWADPVAALLLVPFIWLEGKEALSGKACGCG